MLVKVHLGLTRQFETSDTHQNEEINIISKRAKEDFKNLRESSAWGSISQVIGKIILSGLNQGMKKGFEEEGGIPK